jgi:hypothetical protein
MSALSSKELLDHLLEGNHLSPDQLDQFIQENPDENQYITHGKPAIHQSNTQS